MNITFVDIPVYKRQLQEPYRSIHQLRRRASDLIAEDVMALHLPCSKTVFSRGLLLVASSLKRLGARIEYLHYYDETIYSLSDTFKRSDLACFYVMTPTAQLCLQIAAFAKERNPHIKIAFGGPHITSQRKTILESGLVDFASTYSDSETLRRLIQDSFETRSSGNIHRDPIVSDLPKADDSIDDYIDYSILRKPLSEYYFNISASYGCAYSCRFCSDGTRKLRFRSLPNLAEELMFLDSYLPPGSWVHFFDAIFTFPPERANLICDLIIKNTRNLVFSCDVKARHITHDLARKLHQARFKFISLGFETADDSPLYLSRKGNTFKDCLRAADIVRSNSPGTALKAYWLFGLPGSTRQTCDRDIEQIRGLLRNQTVDIVGPKLFVPYPETPYFRTPDLYGLKIWTIDWSSYDRFHLPPVATPFCYSQSELAGFLMEAEDAILKHYRNRLGLSDERLGRLVHTARRYNGDLYTGTIP